MLIDRNVKNCCVSISSAHALVTGTSVWNIVVSFPKLTVHSALGYDLNIPASTPSSVLKPSVNQKTSASDSSISTLPSLLGKIPESLHLYVSAMLPYCEVER